MNDRSVRGIPEGRMDVFDVELGDDLLELNNHLLFGSDDPLQLFELLLHVAGGILILLPDQVLFQLQLLLAVKLDALDPLPQTEILLVEEVVLSFHHLHLHLPLLLHLLKLRGILASLSLQVSYPELQLLHFEPQLLVFLYHSSAIPHLAIVF